MLVAAKECLTNQISTPKNLSDLLTEVVYSQKRRNLVKGVLCDIYYRDRYD